MYSPHKRIVFVIFSLAMVSSILFFPVLSADATTSTFTLNFQTRDLTFEKSKGFDLISLRDGSFLSSVGEPYLPAKLLQIAIPTDLEVQAVRINWEIHQELEGSYNIYPTQKEYPLSHIPWKDQVRLFTQPDPKVYSLNKEHPGELVQILGHGFLAGQHIVDVVIYPLQYVPSEGKLVFYTQIEFSLMFGPSTSEPIQVGNRSEKTAAFYSGWVKSFVLNPQDVNFESLGKGKQDSVKYLIITDTNFVSAFQPLADWKTQKGVPAKIVTLGWINSNYTGDDEQERIRNCIIDFYSSYGTIWVLLGGDTNILPHRIAYAYTSGAGNYPWEDDIPCDLYYSCLDGNWNADGDDVYGEYYDDVDLLPEVMVGRAPAATLTKANTFVSKSLTYQTNPTTDYMDRMLIAAERLDPQTDGCVLQTYIYNSIVSPCFPDTTVLCESLGNLNKDNFRDALNHGQNIVNHDGHGLVDLFSIGPDDDWYISDMNDLTNSSRLGLLYTLTCLAGAIDKNCILEYWINNPDGGGYGVVGNSRYGWYIPGHPLSGSSADFMMEFYEVLCHSNSYQVGKTLSDSKIPFIPQAQNQSTRSYRWIMYTLNLLGDPESPIFTATPSVLTVSHPESVSMEPQTVDVYVEVEGSLEEGALVCLSKGDEVYAHDFTSFDGWVHLPIDPIASGDMLITVTAQNCLPYQETITITPVIFIDEFTFDDDPPGGNGNGRPEGNETVTLYFTISSDWKPLTGTYVTATVDNPDIVFNDSCSYLGDLPTGGSADNDGDPMEFYVMPDIPITLVHFTLHIVGNGGDDSTYLVTEALVGKSTILLVDDDEGTDPASNVEGYYMDALDSLRAGYDIWDRMSQPDTFYNFSDYEILIWFTGDHRTSIFSEADLESLMSFLDDGGRLFLTSQDAVEVLASSSDSLDSLFLKNYLHVGYDGNNEKYLVVGREGDEVGDTLYIFPNYEVSNQVSKDNLVPDSEADTVLFYTVGGASHWWTPSDLVAGTKFQDDFFKVVLFGFGLESIRKDGGDFHGQYCSKPHFVMQRVLDWFKAIPTINVMYPNGGESWFVDSTYYIFWESISFKDSVKIEYCYIDGGDTTCSTIEDTTTNDGVYSWTVPDTPSDSCLIIISDVDNGNPSDTSDDYFSIINYINVMSPNGEEPWFVDSTYDIKWKSISSKDSVVIEYSINAGGDWLTIKDTTTNDGLYSWTVPDDTTSDSCLVRVSDVTDGDPIDTSDYYFCIIDYLPGDINIPGGDGIVDLGDVVFLINYIFRGGDPPDPMAAGDVNADCVVELGDVVYLINYLYRGGDPPLPSCCPQGYGG
jgi:hypothetical protein